MVSNSVKEKTSKSCKKAGCGRTSGFVMSDEHKQKISDATSGKRNPFYGKKHTEKTKRKMVKNHADFTGKKNPLVRWLNKNPTNRQEYSRRLRDVWANPELQESLSIRNRQNVVRAIADGNHNPYSKCEHGWFESKKFKQKFYFQSSYERRFLEFCETAHQIFSLQRPRFVIDYVADDGKDKVYNPDFIVNGMVMVEVKPESMLPYNNNRKKIAAGKQYCKEQGITFYLVMENELNALHNIVWE